MGDRTRRCVNGSNKTVRWPGQRHMSYENKAAQVVNRTQITDGLRKYVSLMMTFIKIPWAASARLNGGAFRPDLIEKYPDRQSRSDNYQELSAVLSAVFAQRDRQEWMSILEDHDVPFSPELSMEELTRDPQAMHLGILNETHHKNIGTVRGVNRPLHFDGNNESAFYGTPTLGQHSAEILAECG